MSCNFIVNNKYSFNKKKKKTKRKKEEVNLRVELIFLPKKRSKNIYLNLDTSFLQKNK